MLLVTGSKNSILLSRPKLYLDGLYCYDCDREFCAFCREMTAIFIQFWPRKMNSLNH